MAVEGVSGGGGLEAWRALRDLRVSRLQEVTADSDIAVPRGAGVARAKGKDTVAVNPEAEALHDFAQKADDLDDFIRKLEERIEELK